MIVGKLIYRKCSQLPTGLKNWFERPRYLKNPKTLKSQILGFEGFLRAAAVPAGTAESAY